MAKKYDPLKSNMSSYFKKPKKVSWGDRRSGDSVGRGPGKKGSYKAYTAYHSLPKLKPTRRAVRSTVKFSSPRVTTRKSQIRRSVPSSEEWTTVTIHEYTSPEEFEKAQRAETAPEPEITPPPEVDDEKGPVFDSEKPTNTDHCPYCGVVFAKIPKRGRACESCGQKFVFRSRHILYNSDFLTLEEAAANDCFFHALSLTDTPIKWAKEILAENPGLTFTELFIKMIETYDAQPNASPEMVAGAYQDLARYEEQCGRKGGKFKKLAADKNREAKAEWERIEKLARGE